MKRSTDTRWSPAEIQQNQKEHYAAMAEHPPDRKASEKFHRPAYQAGKLIETQGQQLWHGDVTEYIARKYKIGDDANGEETGREQCKISTHILTKRMTAILNKNNLFKIAYYINNKHFISIVDIFFHFHIYF